MQASTVCALARYTVRKMSGLGAKELALKLSDTDLEQARQRVLLNKAAARSILEPALLGAGSEGIKADELGSLNYFLKRTGDSTRDLNQKFLQRTMIDRIKSARERNEDNVVFTRQLAQEMKRTSNAIRQSTPNLKKMEKQLNRMINDGNDALRLSDLLNDAAQEVGEYSENAEYYDGVLDPNGGLAWKDGCREVLDAIVGEVTGSARPEVTISILKAIPKAASWTEVPVDLPGRLPTPPTEEPGTDNFSEQ